MKKLYLALILVICVMTGVYGQTGLASQSGPKDLILVLDTSASMSSSYKDVSAYLPGAFIQEHLRIGDTFHLIPFSGNARLDIARRVEGRGEVETIVSRMLLQYPLDSWSDISTALTFTENYLTSLPNRPKKIVLVSDGIVFLPPGSSSRQLDSAGVDNLISDTKSRLASKGVTFEFVKIAPGVALPSASRSQTGASGSSTSTWDDSDWASTGGTSSAATGGTSGTTSGTTSGGTSTSTGGTASGTTSGGTSTGSTATGSTSTGSTSTGSTASGGTSTSGGASGGTSSTGSSGTSSTGTSGGSTTGASWDDWGTDSDSDWSGSSGYNDSATTGGDDSDWSWADNAFDDDDAEGTESASTDSSYAGTQTSRSGDQQKSGIPSTALFTALAIIGLIALILIILLLSKEMHKSPNKAMSRAAQPQPSQTRDTRMQAAEADAPPFKDHSKDLSSYASSQSKQRTTPYSDHRSPTGTQTFEYTGGPVTLNLFVEDQNTHIGKRNIHSVKPGYTFTVGGGKSDFLIFLVPMPANIGELRVSGNRCTFTPKKAQYFPDGAQPVQDCIGKTIRIVSDKNYEVRFRFERYEDPLHALNRLLNSVKVAENTPTSADRYTAPPPKKS